MSHDLTIIGDRAEMAYVGETPWHGLGQSLTPDASLETWAREAGMEWKVLRSKVRYNTSREGDGASRIWEDQHVLFRSDSGAPLGVVSDRYKVVQPIDVLKFFHDVAERNNLRLETAGTLGGGRKYWALARLGHADINLGGMDILKPYALLATSSDGSMNTTGKLTSERVVCRNTLSMALRGNGQAIKVRHTTTFDPNAVRIELGLMEEEIEAFTVRAATLASKPLTKQQAVQVLVNSIGDPEAFALAYQTKGASKAMEEQPNVRPMGHILNLFDGAAKGANLLTSQRTAWGLVNAATEYFDHYAGRSQDTRLTSAWFGVNEDRKNKIVEEAIKID